MENVIKRAKKAGKIAYYENREELPWKDEKLKEIIKDHKIDCFCDKLILYTEWTRGYYKERRKMNENFKTTSSIV